jgi:membrane protein DedA with SNARE-associated domain
VERHLTQWLVEYGALVLFFAQFFGIFGLPIPDELLLSFAGALIFRGMLNGPSTWIASIAGCLCGITLSYIVGRTAGAGILRRRFANHQTAVTRAQEGFRRFGKWLLTFGYFIPGVRHVTAIIAGSGCLDTRTFVLFAYPGGVLWCSVFLLLGYYGGDKWEQITDTARSHAARGIVVTAFAIGAYVLVRLASERRRVGP